MAEVHIIGQVVGASGFAQPNLFCQWGIVAGQNWRLLEGYETGQTQVDHPEEGAMAVWSHPIDVHYATKGIPGWPKLYFQVWHEDVYGRNDLSGYGFVHIPTSAGSFDLDCVTWRPAGSLQERFSSWFIGGYPQLKNEDIILSGADRFRLRTVASGKVHLHLGVILKNFEKFGVQYA